MKKLSVLLGFCLIMAMAPTFMPQLVSAMPGSGTEEDPYLICNVTDLQNMENDVTAWYVLNCSIDASATSEWNGGAGFDPIGDSGSRFSGHFDGQGYTISNLHINRAATTYIGLFGYTQGVSDEHVTIGNVTVVVNITGYSQVGALVGRIGGYTDIDYVRAYGNVTAAYHDAGGMIGCIDSVSGYMSTITHGYANVELVCGGSYAGGFVGYGAQTYNIRECCAYGDVWCHLGAGGFAGLGGAIYDCYARGNVYLTEAVGGSQAGGGFVGMGTSVYRCYSTGEVHCLDSTCYSTIGGFCGQLSGSAVASFWDGDTCNQEESACATKKTTPEMKTQATFTDVGWNFTGIWDIGGTINDGYPYFDWWYNPPDIIADVNQVVWFQPNAIIEGTTLPNRAQGGTLIDGDIHWGANPAGITITHGELIPEEEYDFVPISPGSEDIIKPDPDIMTGDVDTAGLTNNPFYALVHALGSEHPTRLTDRLVWLIFAWFILIAAMLFVHIGFDTKKGTEKPQHFVLTTIVGLGLSILFYTMGIFPLWVVVLMAFGLIGAIIYERQPVL